VEHNIDILSFKWIEPFNQHDEITDYRVYWDEGESQINLFKLLTPTTFGEVEWIKDNSILPNLSQDNTIALE
jgi:hypothetical protein